MGLVCFFTSYQISYRGNDVENECSFGRLEVSEVSRLRLLVGLFGRKPGRGHEHNQNTDNQKLSYLALRVSVADLGFHARGRGISLIARQRAKRKSTLSLETT